MEVLGSRAAWVMAMLVVVLALPAFGVTALLEYEISSRIRDVQNERAGLARLVTLVDFQDAASKYSLRRRCGNADDVPLRTRADAALAQFGGSAAAASAGRIAFGD